MALAKVAGDRWPVAGAGGRWPVADAVAVVTRRRWPVAGAEWPRLVSGRWPAVGPEYMCKERLCTNKLGLECESDIFRE